MFHKTQTLLLFTQAFISYFTQEICFQNNYKDKQHNEHLLEIQPDTYVEHCTSILLRKLSRI